MTIAQPVGELAILHDERAKRQSAATVEADKLKSALVRVSLLRAQQELDGVDLSARIAGVERQIAHAEQVIAVWPDVQAELDRRIGDVQAMAQADRAGVLMTEYNALLADEKARRVAHAQALVVTAERAYDLGANFNRRKQIAGELLALGQSVAGGNGGYGRYPVTEIGTARGVDNAQRWLLHVQNGTWATAMI